MIGQAQTGTGKTAAFGLPMLDFVDPDDPDTQALVLTPTRELCIQVTQALRTYGKYRGHRPGRRLRRRADPHPAGPAQGRRARSWSGRSAACSTSSRATRSSCTRAATSSSTRPTRCSTSASSRTSRRSSSLTPERPPDRALQRDDAGGDPLARPAPPVRPGHGQGQVGDADHRHRRAVLRRGQAGRQDRHARRGARGRAARIRRSSSCAPRSAASSSTARCATAG